MRQRHIARRICLSVSLTLESLEKRSMLHSSTGVEEVPTIADINPMVESNVHVPASMVLTAFPQLVGHDLWAPETFNPLNSNNRADWLYDPHRVEDDITHVADTFPTQVVNSTRAGPSLPDLVPLSAGYLSPFIDTTEIAGHNLMRFSTAVANQGAGPATLISANSGTPPAGSGVSTWVNPDGTQNVVQQIYTYDGTSFSLSGYRPAGRMVWHSGHSHFHLEGYANYRLLTKNPDGTPGPVAKRTGFDGADAVGDKIGFCLINILSTFTIPSSGASSSTLPGYNKPGQPSTGCGFLQGISVGRADVYDNIYDGQWIDVTGVPNGNYFLEVTLDANNVIQETNEVNNTVLVPYTLNTGSAVGGSILPDRFEPNNTPETATNLGVMGVQNQSGLTAHISNENDYFKFVAASTGTGTVQLAITDRDVDLYLYDSALNLLASSTNPTSGTPTTPALETISYNFVAGQTYTARAHGFGSSTGTSGISSGYTLKMNILPTASTSATDGSASEVAADPATFNIARNGPTSSPLTVNITLGGSATRGVDYNVYQDGVLITGNAISLGNEASSVNLQVVPIADGAVEATENVTLTLGGGAYVVGAGNTASVVINDTPPMAIASNFGFETAQTVSFDFSLGVGASLQASDLVLLNTTTNQVIAATTAQYDTNTNRATFRFGAILPDGNYQATIARASLTHSQGLALGADATSSFFVLCGDLNRDRAVGFDDLLTLVQNYGSSNKTYSQGNVDYDAAGTVDFADLLLLAQNYEHSVLNTPAVAGTGATVRRSSTGGRNHDILN